MLKINTQPIKEPVSMLEAHEQLRIEVDEEDGLIQSYIVAARQYCEDFQNRTYINTVYELWLDKFPDKDYIELPKPPANEVMVTAGAFVTGIVYRILTVGSTDFTLIGAASNTAGVVFTATGAGSGTGIATASGIIKYYGTDNTAYYMAGSDLFLDTKSEPGRICLAYGKSWPSMSLREYNGVCVTYIGGYGTDTALVPSKVKQAILLLIAHWYENRETVNIGSITSKLDFTVESLLWQDRIL